MATAFQRAYDMLENGPVNINRFKKAFSSQHMYQMRKRGLILVDTLTVELAPNAQRPPDNRGRPRIIFESTSPKTSTQLLDAQLAQYLDSGPKPYRLIEKKFDTNYPKLRRAARRLNITIEKRGVPPDYETWWHLPQNHGESFVAANIGEVEHILRRVAQGLAPEPDDILTARALLGGRD